MSAALFNATLRGNPFAAYARNGALPRAVFDFETGIYTHAWQIERGSVATLQAEDGTLAQLPNDTARIVGQGGGRHLLIEAGAMNLCDASKTTAINLTALTPLGEAGGLDRTEIADDGNGYLQFNDIGIAALSSGTEITCSVIIENGTAPGCEFWLGIGPTGSARLRYAFDFGTGSVALIANIDGVSADAGMVALGGGRHRVWITGPIISADTVELCRITGVAGTLAYGAMQAEAAANVTSPILSANGTRAAETLSAGLTDGQYNALLVGPDLTEAEFPVTVAAGSLALPDAPVHKIKRLCLF